MAQLEELVVWKVAVAFCDAVMALDARKGSRLPRRLRDQLVDAASSVPANIVEGYYRHRARQFVLFIDYARGSLGESEARLRIGVIRGVFTQQDIDPILQLARRFAVASWRLRQHLENQERTGPGRT